MAIPVHIITGFLGSGKTTLIHNLIRDKPVDETWAILVNEFGQIGIDQAMFDQRDDVVIKGLPGGCLCCQLAFVLQAGLVNLLARAKPDRVIIEPSGLGHPAGLIDLLRSEAFEGALEIRDIIATLDPRRLDDAKAREHETFKDQLAMADAIAITQCEHSSAEQLTRAHALANAHWPPRKWVEQAHQGELSIRRLLDSDTHRQTAHQTPASHQRPELPAQLDGSFFDLPPAPGKPQQESGSSLGYTSLGLRWHPTDQFALDAFADALTSLPPAARIKGVLNTSDGWKQFNRAGGAFQLTATAWRQDSRLEIIVPDDTLLEADALLEQLQACRLDNLTVS
ncbi:CobW family GTP-binding protein [Vreelandella aquamarina]